MFQLPSQALRRTTTTRSSASIFSPSSSFSHAQVRHATLLRRPKRPYTFTQLVTMSDGSTFTVRTTSPKPIIKLQKDTRNHPLWNPSLEALKNTEEDAAGRLKAFRSRFGRGWDADTTGVADQETEAAASSGSAAAAAPEEDHESFLDLLSGYAAQNTQNEKQMAGGFVEKKKASSSKGRK